MVVVLVVPLVVPLACTGVLLGAFPSVVQEGRGLARVAHIRHLLGAHHIPVAPVSVASLAVEEVGNTGNSFLHFLLILPVHSPLMRRVKQSVNCNSSYQLSFSC